MWPVQKDGGNSLFPFVVRLRQSAVRSLERSIPISKTIQSFARCRNRKERQRRKEEEILRSGQRGNRQRSRSASCFLCLSSEPELRKIRQN